jgi:hypothetical protein
VYYYVSLGLKFECTFEENHIEFQLKWRKQENTSFSRSRYSKIISFFEFVHCEYLSHSFRPYSKQITHVDSIIELAQLPLLDHFKIGKNPKKEGERRKMESNALPLVQPTTGI